MHTGFSRLVTIGLLLISASAAISAQTPPDAARRTNPPVIPTPANGAPGSATLPSPDSPGVAVDSHTYIIGAQDVLGIMVWREPDLTGTVVVRPDGKITRPMIGEIQAAGSTPVDLGKTLAAAYSKYINSPEVMVSVQAVNSKKYYIDGGVNRPGQYFLITPTTVFEALSQAGGFQEFANVKKIRILRGIKTLRFNWKDVSHGKHMDENIYLENGDHIIVPE
jgi:polysaccharide export outer membrane protein